MLVLVPLGVMLSGCGIEISGWLPSAARPIVALGVPVSDASGGSVVPVGVAQDLDRLPPGGRLGYRTADGRSATFELGPLYQSGRGLPCRIGRASIGATTGSVPTTYAFCRQGDQWYEMPAVIISGY